MNSMKLFAFAAALLLTSALVTSVASAAPAASPKPSPSPSPTPAGPFAHLDFRAIGPPGGRMDAVTGVPGDPKLYFAGGLGGLVRSDDGGMTWSEVFEQEPVSSIGAVAVAPSNPKIVYVGTGEPNLRSDIAFGDGVWRSDDGGDSWRHVGLDGTSQIASVIVDPHDPNVVYVAAIGDPYKPGPDRGVYKSTDGGKSWTQVLYTAPDAGASSIVMKPGDPDVLLAGMWQVSRTPHSLVSGGPAGGLFKSVDGGVNWTRLREHGLPDGITGRIGLAFATSTPDRVYALIESHLGVLWSSDDAGNTWRQASSNHALAQRPFYFSELTVDPSDKDHVYFMSVGLWQSKDGGATVKRVHSPSGDNHQTWIDPQDAKRIVVASDAGIAYTVNGGASWSAPNVLISQPYHLAVDGRIPYTVCSEDQDSGAACGTNYDLINGDIEPADWFAPGGGESGWIAFDRADDNIVYGSGYLGAITRYDRRTNQVAGVSPWPEDTSGWGAAALRYRFQWTAPLATDPWDPKALYFGADKLFVSHDRGESWQTISPDLTRDIKAWQAHSGGPITGDNTGPEYYDTIFTIAVSPLRKGEMWVGTDDGYAWLTLDGGKHWRQTTPRGIGMPVYGRIDYIDPSPHDPAAAYMAVEDHERGDRTPYCYATSDYGRTWRAIASDLPAGSYVRMIKEDPLRRGMLYAGTETGLWLSWDDGGKWQQLHDNFPTVPVYDFIVQPRFDDLIVSTHGRSNLVLDDISPLQRYTSGIAAMDAYLFPLRAAYRFDDVPSGGETPGSGDNPTFGADINFFLKRAPSSKQKITIEILRGAQIVRTIGVSDANAGINREWWDFSYDGVDKVKDAAVEGFAGFSGPQAVPGTYTVRLLVAGKTLSQPLDVIEDPRSSATAADMQAQLTFLLRIREDLRHIGQRITALRDARDAADRAKASQAAKGRSDVGDAVTAFDSSVAAALAGLYQPADLAGEDDIRDPIHVYEKLNSLAGFFNGADVAPRPADIEELNELEAQMRAGMAASDGVLTSGLAALNDVLRRDGLASIKR